MAWHAHADTSAIAIIIIVGDKFGNSYHKLYSKGCILCTLYSYTNIYTEAPLHIYTNFCYYISLVEGDNITLTIKVTTDLFTPFNGSVTWKVFSGTEHELPPTAKVINYISDGVFHSNLSLYDLSYYNDIGNYTCTVSNECGTSSVFVYIDISKRTSLLFIYRIAPYFRGKKFSKFLELCSKINVS